MKKTTVFALCSLPLLVAACYTAPEYDESVVKHRKYQNCLGCDVDKIYQHASYKACVEETVYQKQKDKKTVYLGETASGEGLVVPKALDADEMRDPNRVYPVIDVRETLQNAEVVITENQATESDVTVVEEKEVVQKETVTTTTKTVETVTETVTETAVEPVAEDQEDTVSDIANPEQASSFDVEISIEENVDESADTPVAPVVEADIIVDETAAQEPVFENNEKEVLPLEEK